MSVKGSHMDTAREIANIGNALGTMLIAAFVAWIVFQQHRTSRAAYQQGLFERRFAAYKKVWDAIVYTLGPV